MKNYDLSQYILRDGNVMLFPLTKEEMTYLLQSKDVFSSYIRLPYYAKEQNLDVLQKVCDQLDMEDDYWFLHTGWTVVDVKARAIVGFLRLEQVDQFNKIVFQVTDDKCEGIKRDDALNLFFKFLNVNNFYNIVVEDLDKAVANEN